MPALPWVLPQPLSLPKRTCLADPESSPRTKRGHVCKYSLKWKHRDYTWTGSQDGDISSRHETQRSGEQGAFQIYRDPSHTASTPQMQAAGGLAAGGSTAKRSVPRCITSASARVSPRPQLNIFSVRATIEENVTCVFGGTVVNSQHDHCWVRVQIPVPP